MADDSNSTKHSTAEREPAPGEARSAVLIASVGTFFGTLIMFFIGGFLAAGPMVIELVPNIALSGAIWGAIGAPVIAGISASSTKEKQVDVATSGALIWAIITSAVSSFLTHALMI